MKPSETKTFCREHAAMSACNRHLPVSLCASPRSPLRARHLDFFGMGPDRSKQPRTFSDPGHLPAVAGGNTHCRFANAVQLLMLGKLASSGLGVAPPASVAPMFP